MNPSDLFSLELCVSKGGNMILDSIESKFPRLVTLIIKLISMKPQLYILPKLEKLDDISVICLDWERVRLCFPEPKSMPRLNRLILRLGEMTIKRFQDNILSQVIDLDIYISNIKHPTIDIMRMFHNLKILRVTGGDFIGRSLPLSMVRLANIQKLAIADVFYSKILNKVHLPCMIDLKVYLLAGFLDGLFDYLHM